MKEKYTHDQPEHEWEVTSLYPLSLKHVNEKPNTCTSKCQKEKCKKKNPERIKPVIKLLAEYWAQNPELRLGQLIFGLNPKPNTDIFYTEDETLENQLKERLNK